MVYNKLLVASSLIGGAEMVPRVGRRAKYESVAISIADQVAKGIYVINERLRGRSTLASLYKVSPETIRRAMALLEAHGVVKVTQGSGIRVVSAEKAESFLNKYCSQQDLQLLITQMRENMRQQKELIVEMECLMKEVIGLIRSD